jgi:hypothetical protein
MSKVLEAVGTLALTALMLYLKWKRAQSNSEDGFPLLPKSKIQTLFGEDEKKSN